MKCHKKYIFVLVSYLKRLESPRNADVLSMYAKNAYKIPQIAIRNAPEIYNTFGPIRVPYKPNKGAEKNPAKLTIPKTNPY